MLIFFRLLTLLIAINFIGKLSCFNNNIRENYNIIVERFKMRIQKRDITQFFDTAYYSFNGLNRIESVPVLFPLDVCILKINQSKFAASLHINKNGDRNFAIFKSKNGSYEEQLSLQVPLAIGMDCTSFDQKGFVALAYNLTNSIERASEGSPIFQITSSRIKTIQYFASLHLRTVYLCPTANDLFLLQTFVTMFNTSRSCPYFKWSGFGFNKLGEIPCSNAKRLEPFSVDSDSYVAVANYADKFGRTETKSEIYKYDREMKKLVCFQKITTYGAVDVKYFSIPFDEIKKQHFLVFGNSQSKNKDQLEADSVIYKLEKDNFIPYQKLTLYAVHKFLPVENIEIEKFILLVACSNQEIKIYNMNDWKFEESKAQFTEGALGKGVSNMRIFADGHNSYLVIANERMIENETNIFLPIFKQEEHANILRQKIIDWTAETFNKLDKIDVNKLMNEVESATRSRSEHSEDQKTSSANIRIVFTKSLVHPKKNFTINYWKTLYYANQAADFLKTNQKAITKRHATSDDIEYKSQKLSVGTLIVKNYLFAKKVNNIDQQSVQFKNISAERVYVNGKLQKPSKVRSDTMPELLDTLNVDHLKLTGKLNDLFWTDLYLTTLKTSGQQFLKALLNVSTLESYSLETPSNKLNDQDMSKLILIDGECYVVNQDVQFSKSIYAKNLLINDRLNNIHVLHDELDVLLLNSEHVQNVTGRKTFENVSLLEPVIISGKIFGELDKISPFKSIRDSIKLNGDFAITGDVTIQEKLQASNIISSLGSYSLKNVFEKGLSQTDLFDGYEFHFENIIASNHSLISFANGQDLRNLIEKKSEEVQIIKGLKVFKKDLILSGGIPRVRLLNGFDVDQMGNELLSKLKGQNLTGNFVFQNITAKRTVSPSIRLHRKNVSKFLTKSGNQVSEGKLKIKKFKNLKATFKNIKTERKIFGKKTYVLKQTVTPFPEIFKSQIDTVYVENVNVNGFINGFLLEKVEQCLTQLNGNIQYVGKITFPANIKIPKLTFTGKFNGIKVKEFGKCWLQQGVYQVFTAPQIMSNFSTQRGVKLGGKLNYRKFEDLFLDTYRTNRDEHIPILVFEKSVQIRDSLFGLSFNGLYIPEDLLVQNVAEFQVLDEVITFDFDVFVKRDIFKLSKLNGISLQKLNDYFNVGYQTLKVEHAIFEIAPNFTQLNSHKLAETIDLIWFANAKVNLQHHLEIADGYFDGSINFEGPINGMNLIYLKENYFSLSKPQQLTAEIIFSKPVVFQNDFDAERVNLYGPVIERKR